MTPVPRLSFRKLSRALLTALLVPVLLFEEWGWAPLAAMVARLGSLPLWAWLERKVAGLPPWGALLVFFVPVIALFPVKLLALYFFGLGHYTSGLVLLIGAKLVGTAVVARLFQLTLPALMQIPWFARWYPRWKAWKDRVLTAVRHSTPWQAVLGLKAAAQRWWRSLQWRE